MMQGAIDFLLSDGKEAKLLRRKFVFKIVPMLNPDGVIYGNYRCSLLGVDLNRRWKKPNKHLHPTVYWSKRFMQTFAEEHNVVMYCDMHGHSNKKNIFIYGCKEYGVGLEEKRSNVLMKLVPFLLKRKNKLFSLSDSKFRMEKYKENCSRIVAYRQLGISNSFTIEASFYGPTHSAALENRDPKPSELSEDAHMQVHHLESIGRDLCKQIYVFSNNKSFRTELERLLMFLRNGIMPPFSVRRKKPVNKSQTMNSQPDLTQELETEEESDESDFSLMQALEELSESDLPQDTLQEESDSGGSDSNASDNDDKKQEFLFLSSKKRKQKPSKKRQKIPRNNSNVSSKNHRKEADSVPPERKRVDRSLEFRKSPMRSILRCPLTKQPEKNHKEEEKPVILPKKIFYSGQQISQDKNNFQGIIVTSLLNSKRSNANEDFFKELQKIILNKSKKK